MINDRFECEILRASRTRLSQLMQTIDHEILFEIPEGFNNNILWQIGHCITSQQRHMYMRSGLAMYISQEFMEYFQIGSSPHAWKIMPDLDEVKYLLIDTVDRLESDLKSGLFVNYAPFELPWAFRSKIMSRHYKPLIITKQNTVGRFLLISSCCLRREEDQLNLISMAKQMLSYTNIK